MGQQEMQCLLCITPAAAVAVAVDNAGQDAVRSKAGGFLGHCVAAFQALTQLVDLQSR